MTSPSAPTEDRLRRVSFPVIVRSQRPSTSGTPPRGESSPRCPVLSPRSPSDRTARSSSLPRTTGGAWWPSTWSRGGCSGRPRSYPEIRAGRSTSVPTVPRSLHRVRTANTGRVVIATGRRPQASSAESRCEAGDAMAVAPDGRTVATGRIENGEAYIDVLDLPSGRRTASWRAGMPNVCTTCSSAPMGSRCSGRSPKARHGFNQNSYFGQIWDPGTGRPTSPLMARHVRWPFITPSADRLCDADAQACGSYVMPPRPGEGLRLSCRTVHSLPRIRTVVPCLQRPLTARSGLWQISADAEPVSDGGTDKQASMTGSAPDRQMAGCHALPDRSAGGWADRRLAGRGCGGTGTDPIIRSRDRSPHGKARAALPRLDRP